MQCHCLTKVGSRSRSQFKIKHCMTVFRVRSISFEPIGGFTNIFVQMSSMMRRCAVPMFDQGRFKSWSQSQGKRSFLNLHIHIYINKGFNFNMDVIHSAPTKKSLSKSFFGLQSSGFRLSQAKTFFY